MKIIKTLLTSLTVTFLLSSCQKESDLQSQNGNDKLIGTWNFVGMSVSMKATAVNGTGMDQEKLVNSYSFVATNPSGKVVIDAQKITSNSLTYSFNTIVLTQMYLGGVLFDSFQTPFDGTMPPSSGSTNYTSRGTDSLRLESGFVSFDPAGGLREVLRLLFPRTVELVGRVIRWHCNQ